MRKTMRVLATLSILASSLLFAQSASAIGPLYSPSTGTGDVECSISGWISIYQNEVYAKDKNCRGTADIPSGVLLIRDNAFNGDQLSAITIPNTVTTIGDSAFAGSHLISITIPNSVTSINQRTFEHAHELTSVNVDHYSRQRYFD